MADEAQPVSTEAPKKICGVIMPISAIDGCSEQHWSDVYDLLAESIDEAGFEPNLVSNADEVGIIHKRIIQNLYENEIVVCDVSGKNPNVMFELGLRLAFDKPTIIVKDDKTPYSFDTAAIEHLEYPRDLRYSKIVDFKERLAEKITATHQRATSDASYTTFLKHFGEFTVAKIERKEVPSQQYVIDELKSIRRTLVNLEQRPSVRYTHYDSRYGSEHDDYDDNVAIELDEVSAATASLFADRVRAFKWVRRVQLIRTAGKRSFVAIVETRGRSALWSRRLRDEAHRLTVTERRLAQPAKSSPTAISSPPETTKQTQQTQQNETAPDPQDGESSAP